MAFPILVTIIASQSLCLGLAAAYRPFISAFLNFLEVICGALDVATLVITAIVYRRKQERQAAGAPQGPGQGDAGFAKVGSGAGWQDGRMAGWQALSCDCTQQPA